MNGHQLAILAHIHADIAVIEAMKAANALIDPIRDPLKYGEEDFLGMANSLRGLAMQAANS